MFALEHEMLTFSDAVRSEHPEIAGRSLRLSARPGANAHARLGIYRNNTFASLTAVLLAVFPVTARLMDERFFRFVSHEFIRSNPPSEPRLSQFGGAFPAFLAGLSSLAEVPFVAETARLEWTIAGALDRADVKPMQIGEIARLEDAAQRSLILQPSLRLFVSRWPVFSIWTAHQGSAEPALGLVKKGNAERVAIARQGTAIRLLHIDAAHFTFLHLLVRGETLAKAADRAIRTDPLFDLATALAQIFSEGLVVGVTQNLTN